MIANKLQTKGHIRIIAPSFGLNGLDQKMLDRAKVVLGTLGFICTFGHNIDKVTLFDPGSIEARLQDLHVAFTDPQVEAVLILTGGFNANQLLKYIDYEIIQQNPKIICGYSDATALLNAIYAKTGLLTYCGPNYATFGEEYVDDTVDFFVKCLTQNNGFEVSSADNWFETGRITTNSGYWPINYGQTDGRIIGGNLCTLNLLQGTQYMPPLNNAVLFIEDDFEVNAPTFDRDLQSIIHLEAFESVKGIVIGRFQTSSRISRGCLVKMIKSKPELNNIPIIANVDFGHTKPLITFPIGGWVQLKVSKHNSKIKITEH